MRSIKRWRGNVSGTSTSSGGQQDGCDDHQLGWYPPVSIDSPVLPPSMELRIPPPPPIESLSPHLGPNPSRIGDTPRPDPPSVQEELRKAKQTIGELFLEKEQFQHRIRELEEQAADLQRRLQAKAAPKTINQVAVVDLSEDSPSEEPADNGDKRLTVVDVSDGESSDGSHEQSSRPLHSNSTPTESTSSKSPQHETSASADLSHRISSQSSVTSATTLGALMPTPQRMQYLKEELRKARAQAAESQASQDSFARELQKNRAELRQARGYIQLAEQRLKENTLDHETELAILRSDLEDAKELATRSRQEPSRPPITFTPKVNTLSVSEIVEKVETLNEEIFQAAVILSDLLVHKSHTASLEEMDNALGISRGLLGGKLTSVLREQSQSQKNGTKPNPFVVHVMLLVFLVNYSSSLVQSWSPSDSNYASYLAGLYSKIREKEEQTFSGTWRSLTRTYTRPTADGWQEDLLKKLGFVLQIASWASPRTAQWNAFEERLDSVIIGVMELREALGEKFISADLEVSVPGPDQPFEPRYMEDAFVVAGRGVEGTNSVTDIVVGTTGIGLKKAMGTRTLGGDVVYENLLPAKVALESTLQEALKPQPARKDKKKIFPW